VSPLQQQRPLVGDGLRLRAVWWVGDEFLSVRTPLALWGSTNWSTGGGKGVLAQLRVAPCNEGLRNAHFDKVSVRPSPQPLSHGERGFCSLIPANLTQGFGIGAADGDLGVVGEGEDGFAVAAFDVFHSTSGHPP